MLEPEKATYLGWGVEPVTCKCDIKEQSESFADTPKSIGRKHGDDSWAPKPPGATDMKPRAPHFREDDSKTTLNDGAPGAEHILLCPLQSLGKQVP